MIDEIMRGLAGRVMAGELEAAGLLLDRLHERDDHRRHELYRILGILVSTIEMANNEGEEGGSFRERVRRRPRTKEEIAYWRDEDRYSAWSGFAKALQILFWAELSGFTPLATLQQLGQQIDASKQASRFAADPRTLAQDYPDGMIGMASTEG